MNKTSIKNFAIWARNKLIADIQYRAGLMGITAEDIKPALPQSTAAMEFYDIGTAEPYAISGNAIRQRGRLVEIIRQKERDSDYPTAYKYILEEVAYTWFNRLIAIRFMEVNDYLPSHIRVLSSESGKVEPDLVTTPFDAGLDFSPAVEETILRLKTDNQLDELFRLLFVKQCNALSEILPALFEPTSDYTELLLNLSVVDQEGVVYHLVHDIAEDDFNVEKGGQVEIIGWLYQYYNTEPHNEIVNIYKGTVKTEDIPAATQLFTTDWVVRYIVDNSLGRYWLERHPESRMREKLQYLVLPKGGELPSIAEMVTPQELTFLDPCVGSGHVLVYAFDVLMNIYEECGYSTRDAAAEIIRNNLFGLDIDSRAYQLAYFAIMMKARQYDRRFLSRGIQPQVYAPNADKELLQFGSLVQVDELIDKPQEPEELTLFDEDYQAALNDWNYRRLLSQKYVAVCTNPPYLNKYNPQLKEYVNDNYKDYAGDLFSVFIYRDLLLCRPGGYCGFMSPFVWMFIKTYEKLREFIIQNKSITTLIQMEYSAFEEATVPICSFVLQNKKADEPGLYFRLSDFKGGMEVQRQKVLEAIADPDCGYFYTARQNNFSKIPGAPVSYWISDNLIKAFQNKTMGEIARPRQGMATTNNNLFLRLWYEVSNTCICLNAKNREDALLSHKKWFPYNKGGEYRKWYGNNDYLILWENDGSAIKQYLIGKNPNIPRGETLYFKRCFSWSLISSALPAFRYKDQGNIFDIAGMSCFSDNNLLYLLALCNSIVAISFLAVFSPTINFQAGDIANIPVAIVDDQVAPVENIVKENIELSKRDWDSSETSWDFKRHPLV